MKRLRLSPLLRDLLNKDGGAGERILFTKRKLLKVTILMIERFILKKDTTFYLLKVLVEFIIIFIHKH